jgi:putative DNA primase/helicase
MTTSDLSNSALNLLNNESILPDAEQSCQELPESTQFCQELPKVTQTYSSISDKHLAEWVQGSGVDPGIVDLKRCLRSLRDRAVVAARLGWKKYSDNLPLGWWVSGLDLTTMKHQSFGQYKPDEEIRLNVEDEDTQKYLTPKKDLGPYDAIALPHATDKNYWQRILDDPSIPIDLDEGGKKSGAGMTCGFPSLALCGVTMWQFKGELVSNLAALAVPGRTFRIRFDMDVLTKKEVRLEVKKLVKTLEKRDCSVLVAMWNPELGLKIDDVLVKHGPEMVKKIMADAVPYPQWLKSLEAQMKESDSSTVEGKKKEKKELPPPSVIAEKLGEIYRDKLAWESEYQLWRHYGAKHDGLWGVETEETVKGLIHAYLRSQGLPGFAAGYVSSIATILKSDLEVTDWDEQTGLIPLQDGVLNQVTQKLKPHAPGYRFTWQLPFKWSDRSVGCEPIEKFFLKITGNQDIANVLLAICSAVVTRRADLQRFVEFIGGGGTGKSTCMAILRALAGSDNTVSSQLKHLENNQFETAKFYGKILALFPDSERWQGEISVLKQLTGQDPIRYERKGVQQCKDFIYNGMVVISANEAPESRDLTSGGERRKLTIHLDTRVPEYQDRNLIKEFEPYLPGLLKRVLDIPREEVTRLIKHTDREVPALAAVKWQQLCETNPIAGWLDEKIILKPDAKAYIGLGDVEEAGRWLFANFCKYQQDNGHRNTVTLKWFSKNLRDLLKNQMKADIREGRDRDGNYIEGIGLRCLLDPGSIYPRSVTKMPFCDGLMKDGDGFVTAETIGSAGFAGCDGFLKNSNDTENLQLEISLNTQKNQPCPVDKGKNSSHPTHPASVKDSASINPTHSGKNPSHPPKTSPPPESKIKVGDTVQVRLDYRVNDELRGSRAVVLEDLGNGYYQIDFGRKIKISDAQSKQSFRMDKQWLQIVTNDERDLPNPF